MNIDTSQDEFWNFLEELYHSNDYQYKFLRSDIALCIQGRLKFYDTSVLNIQNDSWVLIIHSESIMVYGKDWSKNQLEEVKESFNLARFTNYLIKGDTCLINDLIHFHEIENFEVEMERLFYKANQIISFRDEEIEIMQPEEQDLDTLALMLQQFYHEEYGGENDKTIEEMLSRVMRCFHEKTMYILKNSKGNIMSFCTIINPDIGILFTNQEFRNRGYGKIILSYCAELLLQNNPEVYLMTIKSKFESNAACKRVGFNEFFEYSYLRINKN